MGWDIAMIEVNWTALFGLVVAAMTGMVGIVGYFLKKIHTRVETTSDEITKIHIKVASLSEEFRKSIIGTFNEICTERQGSCYKVHEARFKALEASDLLNCSKITHLEMERKDAWKDQRRWNEKIDTAINHIGIRKNDND
jgi:hypothetical protein